MHAISTTACWHAFPSAKLTLCGRMHSMTDRLSYSYLRKTLTRKERISFENKLVSERTEPIIHEYMSEVISAILDKIKVAGKRRDQIEEVLYSQLDIAIEHYRKNFGSGRDMLFSTYATYFFKEIAERESPE